MFIRLWRMAQAASMPRLAAPALLLLAGLLPSCATSATHHPGADFAGLGLVPAQEPEWSGSGDDESVSAGEPTDIDTNLRRQPTAQLPAKLAVVHVQQRQAADGPEFAVESLREVETEDQLAHLTQLPFIADVSVLHGMIAPDKLQSAHDLRSTAASVQADLLLAYTFDTRVDVHQGGLFGILTLGLLPDGSAKAVSTASAVLVDTRSGFVYGLAESTARHKKGGSLWSIHRASREARREAESLALTGLLSEFDALWIRSLEQNWSQRVP